MAKVTDDPSKTDDENIDEDEGGDQPPKKSDNDNEDADDDEGKDNVDDDIIPVRKSTLVAQQHIIARKNQKIKELEDGDEDDLLPEADERINRKVADAIEPLKKHIISRADEDELSELYSVNPDAKDFDKQIRKYMLHPSWQAVPIAAIYHHLAFGKAAEDRNGKKNAADIEGQQSRVGGHSRRPKPSSSPIPELDNIDDMDDDEIEKLSDRAKSGEFID